MADSDSSSERYTVRSVARAVGVLELLADSPREGRSVTEIGEACGLSKSAAFAVLQTLLAAKFVADSGAGQNRRYRLGRGLTRLGDLARDALSIREVARPVLERLAAELRLSVRLGLVDGDRVAMVDRADAPTGVRIDLRMGDREPLHCTAVGKALLAQRPDDEVTSLLGTEPLSRHTPHTITTVADLLDHLHGIRRRGYSVDDEEDVEGILCVGAAVHDESADAVAAISVTMLKAGTSKTRVADIGAAVADGAAEISRILGHHSETPLEPESSPADGR